MVFRCMYLSGSRGLAEWPFSEVGMGSIVSGLSPVQQLSAKGCLWWLSAGLPTTALSDSLSFTLPGALHVLEALIGPELDCGGPDYWCQCVPGHVGPLELLVPSPGHLAAKEEKGGVCVPRWNYISQSWLHRVWTQHAHTYCTLKWCTNKLPT